MTSRAPTFAVFSAALLGLAGCPKPGTGLHRWVALGEGGVPIARVVTQAAACPSLVVDGAPKAMSTRADGGDSAFPVRVCEAALPGAKSARVDGDALPLPSARPARIAVLGDTGCRIKGKHAQDCRSSATWPFARIAKAIADWKPDLVVHAGDYLYREHACPDPKLGCGGPDGDAWRTWEVDFFAPAAPALRSAPWVFTRGNHEICKRAGKGWFRLLEPRLGTGPDSLRCANYTPPYAVPLGDDTLLVFDTADITDHKRKEKQVRRMLVAFDAAKALVRGRVLVGTHKPLWALVPDRSNPQRQYQQVAPPFTEAIAKVGLPPGLDLWLAGHTHHFQALAIDGQPSMVMSGHGGTALLPPVPGDVVGAVLPAGKVTSGKTFAEWGFVALERKDGGWVLEARDVDGKVRARCTLTPSPSGPAKMRCE